MSDCSTDRTINVRPADGYWIGRFSAMAGPCEVLSEAGNAGQARALTQIAALEAWRIEDKFSRYRHGNIVDRINSAAGSAVAVDAETAHLLDFADTLHRLSDGRFDITSGGLRRAWSFDGSDRVPSAEVIAAALRTVGWQRASWSAPVLQMPPEMQIDLGGIGKEYAVDRAVGLLRDNGPISCLVNFGGDLAVTRRPRFRPAWGVGVEAFGAGPAVPSSLLRLEIGALATSGDARRYVLRDGVRYGHILDPATGWPVPDAPHAVTVAADTCTQAGMLSTLAMLAGQGAEAFLARQGVRCWVQRDAAAEAVTVAAAR
jgi:FAD:protein FMN transferase